MLTAVLSYVPSRLWTAHTPFGGHFLVMPRFYPAPHTPPDLEWKVIYVGSASSPEHDQELDSVLVGPVPVGTSKFLLSVRPAAEIQRHPRCLRH